MLLLRGLYLELVLFLTENEKASTGYHHEGNPRVNSDISNSCNSSEEKLHILIDVSVILRNYKISAQNFCIVIRVSEHPSL